MIDPMGDPVMVPTEVRVVSVDAEGEIDTEGELELVSKEEGVGNSEASAEMVAIDAEPLGV